MSEFWILGTYASDTFGKIWRESSGVTGVSDLSDVSDLYILNFSCLKYRTRNSPSQMGLRKSLSWEERDLYYIFFFSPSLTDALSLSPSI
jgi:hypothetical protein